jgi:hypothetical protein
MGIACQSVPGEGSMRTNCCRLRGTAKAYALCVALGCALACSEDDDAPRQGSDGGAGRDVRDAGDAGDQGNSGTGGRGGGGSGAGNVPSHQYCGRPDIDPADDACLACLTRTCCGELLSCGPRFNTRPGDGGPNWPLYTCYEGFLLGCIGRCFEDAVADAASLSSDASAQACLDGCDNGGASRDVYQRLLDCALSLPGPDDSDGGIDDDAGSSDDGCGSVCRFSGWQ